MIYNDKYCKDDKKRILYMRLLSERSTRGHATVFRITLFLIDTIAPTGFILKSMELYGQIHFSDATCQILRTAIINYY